MWDKGSSSLVLTRKQVITQKEFEDASHFKIILHAKYIQGDEVS